MAARWTSKEIELLSDRAGLDNYNTLSKRLGRSKNAIKLFRCRNRLPRFYDTFYSYTLLAKELGKSRRTIRWYHQKGWLSGKKASWRSFYGNRPMIFTEDNIVSFLRKHYLLFDWRKIPNRFFRNIVRECVGK